MAYAAVLSLENTINGLVRYSSPEILKSAYEDVCSLLSTLEMCSDGVGDMDDYEQMIIIEAAIKLEDAIEFSLLSHQSPTFSLDLNHDIHCFVQTAKEREQTIKGSWEQKAAKEIEEDTEGEEEEEDVEMVGLCDQFLQIRDKVLKAYEVESNYFWKRVIWISGMAGIGKTALAKKVFHDPLIKANFQYRAFVRVGLKFWSEDRFLEAIRDQLNLEMVGLCDQFLQIRDMVLAAYEEPESNRIWDRMIWISGMAGIGKTALAKKVFHDLLIKTRFRSRAFIRLGLKFWSAERIVQGIRDQLNLDNRGMTQNFLLFLDDVWDTNLIWSLFHETWVGKEKGIAVLLTSRTDKTYGPYFSVKMRFMDEEESWELLRRKVFGEEEQCPPQLVKAGKKIAEKCEGLPLLINAVAPILLSKAQKDPERWNRVAHKPDSILEEASHQISQVLLKSYYQLTEHDKLSKIFGS